MSVKLEEVVKQNEIPIKLITDPILLYSPYLSKKTGLNISILDYSQTSTGTHKIQKAVKSVQEAKQKNKNVFLFINSIVDSREDSNGSGIDALELASAVYSPESYVVSIVHSESPYIKPEPINEDFPDRKKRIVFGIDLNEFWSKEKLEDYFKDVIYGRVDFDNGQVEKGKSILGEKFNCVDLTNLENCSCYNYSEDLVKKLKDFDYLIGSAGTGERALGQISSVKSRRLKHMIVFPFGHVLDPYHRQEESDSKRVQAKFRVKTHDKLLEESVDRDDIIYKTAGLFFGGEQAKEMFVEPAIEKDGFNMVSGSDGAIGFSILKQKDNPEHKNYFNEKGLKVFNTHKVSEKGLFNYIDDTTTIPYGSEICIINSGISNNNLLKELIAKRIIK